MNYYIDPNSKCVPPTERRANSVSKNVTFPTPYFPHHEVPKRRDTPIIVVYRAETLMKAYRALASLIQQHQISTPLALYPFKFCNFAFSTVMPQEAMPSNYALASEHCKALKELRIPHEFGAFNKKGLYEAAQVFVPHHPNSLASRMLAASGNKILGATYS